MLEIEATIDFVGFADYWRGHGHAFADPSLICCIRFGVPITYSETVEEIIELILEDINSVMEPFEVINEKLWRKYEHRIRNIPDSEYRKALEDLIDTTDLTERFIQDEFEAIPEDYEGELPMLIGWFHIYAAE